MKIALYGIGGTYNFGCEAIVRGTEKIIHSSFPDAVLDYYSYKPEEDRERLGKVNINVIPLRIVTQSTLMKTVAKLDALLVRVFRKTPFLYERWMFSWVKNYDYILSIGGDIYTLPPDNECKSNSNYTNSLIKFGEYCHYNGCKLVVWGASIGPFEKYPLIKKIFMEHLKICATFITVREEHSYLYLKKNGFENIFLFGDPAFTVQEGANRRKENYRIIGINLSPLSGIYLLNGGDLDKIVEQQILTIRSIIKNFGCKIYLIPHVFSSTSSDDDFNYLRLIYDALHMEGLDVELKKTESFCDAKKTLSECSLVISARMHCAINALTEGVPSIFLSYSEKTIGMSKMVYGTDEYALKLNDFNDEEKMICSIKKIFDNYTDIQKYIRSSVNKLRESAYMAAGIFSED